MFLLTRPLLQPPRVTGVLSEMLFSFWSLKGTTQDIRTGCCCTLWLERARRMYKSQHYQKCEKANRPGADFPDLSRDRIFQQPAPSGFKGTIRGELAVREGRNEDKWSKVQPRNCREKSLFLTSSRVGEWCYSAACFMHRKPGSGARPVIISKIRKLSPGRLWRLGGFQRLDTSSVFWPRRSQSASAEVPVSWSRKSKSADQKNPHQEKLLSSLKEKM